MLKTVYLGSEEKISDATDQLALSLLKSGLKLKGHTFSGSHPQESLSNEDGTSVIVGGLRWYPKEDSISLNILVPETMKSKKFKVLEKFLEKLKRHDCVSSVYEIIDPSGKVNPVLSGLKIDLHELVVRILYCDDKTPENLRPTWTSNFEAILDIQSQT